MKEKTIQDTEICTSMVAKKQGWIINPNTELTTILVKGLTTNINRYGYYLCPCRDSDGSRESDKDVICPCVFAHDDITTYGHCFCSLYMSSSFIKANIVPHSIKDKRYSKE